MKSTGGPPEDPIDASHETHGAARYTMPNNQQISRFERLGAEEYRLTEIEERAQSNDYLAVLLVILEKLENIESELRPNHNG